MKILNIGCGPVRAGDTPGIEIVNVDRRDHPGAILGDMEDLDYDDSTFDLVVCVNALDHTPNAAKALSEFYRVVKKGGWIYIDCALIQHTTSGKGHYWDMLEDGTMESDTDFIDLMMLGYKIEFIDNGMERRYNHVIARLTK